MATKRFIIQKIGDKYVPVPVGSYPRLTKTTWSIFGALLTLGGIKRGGIGGATAAATGGWILWNTARGQQPHVPSVIRNLCSTRCRTAKGSASYQHDDVSRPTQKPLDEVDEALMESFPASDPPAKMASSATT